MKILIIVLISLTALHMVTKVANANDKPIIIKYWMTTGYLVKNKYVRCNKVWYPKNYKCVKK